MSRICPGLVESSEILPLKALECSTQLCSPRAAPWAEYRTIPPEQEELNYHLVSLLELLKWHQFNVSRY